jgi:hypothetical protein
VPFGRPLLFRNGFKITDQIDKFLDADASLSEHELGTPQAADSAPKFASSSSHACPGSVNPSPSNLSTTTRNPSRPEGLTKNQYATYKKRNRRCAEYEAANAKAKEDEAPEPLKKRAYTHRFASTSNQIAMDFCYEDQFEPVVTEPAWVGRKEPKQDWRVYDVDFLQESYGMELYNWNGL